MRFRSLVAGVLALAGGAANGSSAAEASRPNLVFVFSDDHAYQAISAYQDPRNEAFRQANLQGEDLVRWKYNRYMHDYLGCIRSVDASLSYPTTGGSRRGILTLDTVLLFRHSRYL